MNTLHLGIARANLRRHLVNGGLVAEVRFVQHNHRVLVEVVCKCVVLELGVVGSFVRGFVVTHSFTIP